MTVIPFSKKLFVCGDSEKDIFKALVSILKSEVIERIGNIVNLDCDIEERSQEFVDVFVEYGFKLSMKEIKFDNCTDSVRRPTLKDFKVKLHLGWKIIEISFDYLEHTFDTTNVPYHLE